MINLRCSGVFFLLLAASAGAFADSQVYIWQRVWNDQHKTALRQSQALFATLRVLGIQFHPQEGVRLARVNTSLLQQDGRPVWLVVRLDGSLTQLDITTMLPQIKRLVTHWRKAGVNLTAIEIDYDAPTSRLSDYQTSPDGHAPGAAFRYYAQHHGAPDLAHLPRTASFAESGR